MVYIAETIVTYGKDEGKWEGCGLLLISFQRHEGKAGVCCLLVTCHCVPCGPVSMHQKSSEGIYSTCIFRAVWCNHFCLEDHVKNLLVEVLPLGPLWKVIQFLWKMNIIWCQDRLRLGVCLHCFCGFSWKFSHSHLVVRTWFIFTLSQTAFLCLALSVSYSLLHPASNPILSSSLSLSVSLIICNLGCLSLPLSTCVFLCGWVGTRVRASTCVCVCVCVHVCVCFFSLSLFISLLEFFYISLLLCLCLSLSLSFFLSPYLSLSLSLCYLESVYSLPLSVSVSLCCSLSQPAFHCLCLPHSVSVHLCC